MTEMREQPLVMTSASQDILPLLRRFCDDGSSRYSLDRPFVQKGRLYCTDGLIAVSILSDDPDTEGKFPNMASVMDYETPVTTPWNITIADCELCGGKGSVESTKCESCKGSGECSECDGSGTEVCYACSHEHDCDACDGTGSCDVCNGDGTTEAYKVKCEGCEELKVDLGNASIKVSLARKISLLSNVRYSVVEQSRGFRLIVFEADGGIRGVASGRSS